MASPRPDLPPALARVNVVGTSGSGKSTFSRRLAALLAAPHVEMDRLFWGPAWQGAPPAAFDAALAEALRGPRWVLDGNYSRTVPIKWAAVDAVIWLDFPFAVTLRQAVGRALRRCWTRAELWPGTGNRESFVRSFLSRDSILLWTIRTWTKNRRAYAAAMADPQFARIRFVRLRSRRQAAAFLAAVAASRRPIAAGPAAG